MLKEIRYNFVTMQIWLACVRTSHLAKPVTGIHLAVLLCSSSGAVVRIELLCEKQLEESQPPVLVVNLAKPKTMIIHVLKIGALYIFTEEHQVWWYKYWWHNLIYTKSVKKIMKVCCHATVFYLRSKTGRISVVLPCVWGSIICTGYLNSWLNLLDCHESVQTLSFS